MDLAGYIGAHIIGGAGGGYSRDTADRVLADLGGKPVVVVNDYEMIRKVLERGGIAAHRINRGSWLDDDGDAHFDAVAYVDLAHTELSVAETGLPANRRGVIYLGNELGTGTPARTEEWLVRGCDRATALNRKVVMGNWSYLNPYDGYFPKIERAIKALKRNGGWMGHHWGTDGKYPTYEAAFASGAIGRGLWESLTNGYKIWLTEFAGSLTAHDGYKALYPGHPEKWVEVLAKTVVNLCVPHNILLSIFTMFEWQRDFAFYNDPALIKALSFVNERYPVVTQPPAPPVNIPADPGDGTPMRVRTVGLRMRTDHNTSATVIRTLTTSEPVTVYAETVTPLIDKYSWVYLTTAKDKGWAAIRGAWGESFTPLDAPKLELIMPVGCDVVITSKFGVPRDYDGDGILDDKHEGLDVAPSHKNCTPLILAGADGVVDEVSSVGSYGIHIKVRHVLSAATFVTWYCHLQKAFVKTGDTVKQGDYIGVMGSTGNSSGVHLHLNVQHLGHGLTGFVIPDATDPLSYIEETASLSLVA